MGGGTQEHRNKRRYIIPNQVSIPSSQILSILSGSGPPSDQLNIFLAFLGIYEFILGHLVYKVYALPLNYYNSLEKNWPTLFYLEDHHCNFFMFLENCFQSNSYNAACFHNYVTERTFSIFSSFLTINKQRTFNPMENGAAKLCLLKKGIKTLFSFCTQMHEQLGFLKDQDLFDLWLMMGDQIPWAPEYLKVKHTVTKCSYRL